MKARSGFHFAGAFGAMRVVDVGVCRMVVVVRVGMIMIMMVMMIFQMQAAFPGAEAFAQIAGFYRGTGRIGTLAFHMVVMAFLNRADFGLKPQNLSAVFTHGAVGRRYLACLFGDPGGEGFQHFRVITKIGSFDKLDIRVFGGDLIGKTIDAVDQDA